MDDSQRNWSNVFDHIEAQSLSASPIGISTGLQDLDAFCRGGLQRGHLVIVGGRPKMGKSSFALHLAHHISLESPVPQGVFLCSLEATQQDIRLRLLSQVCSIPSDRLQTGQIRAEEWEPLGQGITKLGLWIK